MQKTKNPPVGQLLAKDIMKKNVILVREDMTVAELARFFQERSVTGAPVVNEAGQIVGVVSKSDIVRLNARRSEEEGRDELAPFFRSSLEDDDSPTEDEIRRSLEQCRDNTRVREIMTPPVVSARENFTVAEIAKIMIRERVHRVLILDAAGQLKGIISTMDVVRAVTDIPAAG